MEQPFRERFSVALTQEQNCTFKVDKEKNIKIDLLIIYISSSGTYRYFQVNF